MAGSKRDRELAREHYLRQQERRNQERAKGRQRQQVLAATVAVVAVLAGVALIAFLMRDDEPTDIGSPLPSASAEPSTDASAAPGVPLEGCTEATGGPVEKPTFEAVPEQTVEAANYTASITTNCGPVELSLDAAKAPKTVNSFAFLAGEGYFDGTACHRLVNSGIFVLQCGDPTFSGSGGPGYSIPDENLPAADSTVYPAGTVAMANSGPNTNGSQFFLVFEDSQLGPNYTVLGSISEGLDVLQRIGAAGDDGAYAAGGGGGKPNQPVVLEKVTVEKTA